MKTGKISTRVLAFVLCAMMVIGVVPMTAFAAVETEGTFPNSQLSLVQDTCERSDAGHLHCL